MFTFPLYDRCVNILKRLTRTWNRKKLTFNTRSTLYYQMTALNPHGIMATDSEGYIRYANDAACKMINVTHEQLIGVLFSGILSAGDSAELKVKSNGYVRIIGVQAIKMHWEGREWRVIALTDASSLRPVARITLRQEENRAVPPAGEKNITGLISVCGWCKKVRNDDDAWISMEQYVRERSTAKFTHCLCPDCAKKIRQGLGAKVDPEETDNEV